MLEKIRTRRPSAAMVVACLALFVALGGASVAAIKLKPNSVKTKNIKNSAVITSKIADGAVTEPKIAKDAVTSGQIANAAVTSGKLASGSVTKVKTAASGTATNTNAFVLQNSCTVATFTATGVQPGDVVSFSFRDPGLGSSLLIAQPAEDEVTANGLKLQICEVNNVAANISIGSLVMDFVAIR